MTEEEAAAGANVVELLVEGISPLPPGQQQAADVVGGKDGKQGSISFSVGISLPGNAAAEVPGLALSVSAPWAAGGLAFPLRLRRCMTREQQAGLRVREGGGGAAAGRGSSTIRGACWHDS